MKQKIMKILCSGVVACTVLLAESPMALPQGMPDMSQMQEQMMESMKMMQYLNAPIEDATPIRGAEVEKFISWMHEDEESYDNYGKKLQAGFSKAAKVLKPGVSYDTFLAKAIELSGVKSELDREARKRGYKDALTLMLKTTRITRAVMKLKMDEEFAKMPVSQRAMVQSMMGGMLAKVKEEDIVAVKPYYEQLKPFMEKE